MADSDRSGAGHDTQGPSKFHNSQKEGTCGPKRAKGASELDRRNPEVPQVKKRKQSQKASLWVGENIKAREHKPFAPVPTRNWEAETKEPQPCF